MSSRRPAIALLLLAALTAITAIAVLAGDDRPARAADPADARPSLLRPGVAVTPAAVPADRRGLRDSVQGRLARLGGTAEVRSSPGEGTEVELVLPRTSP